MLPGLIHVGRIANSLWHFLIHIFFFGILTVSFISLEKVPCQVKCVKTPSKKRREWNIGLPRNLDPLPKYLNNLVFWFSSSKLLLKSLAN